MSRMPIRTFLVAAKRQLQDSIRDQTYTSFVIGNESADLDSITCALVYGYIQSSKIESKRTGRLVVPIANLPASDLPLRTELTALLKHAGIKPSDLITLDDLGTSPLPLDKTDWTLVDHNALQGQLGERYRSRVVGVIDHHEDDNAVPKDAALRIIEKCGSCNSLMINSQRETWQSLGSMVSTSAVGLGQDDILIDDFAYASTWDGQVAKLSLGSILIDTGNMEIESKVTDHDRKAVRYLEAKINVSPKLGKDYDRKKFFNEIHDAKMEISSLSLADVFRKDYKEWKEGDLTLGMSSVVQSYSYLQATGEDLQAALKSFAQKKSLDLYSITTSGTDESGQFYKEILLTALGGQKATKAVERFVAIAKDDLQLGDRDGVKWSAPSDPDISFQHLWNQGNVEASRKQVAPFLRKAMADQ
ncbi:related to exopolyphosphatase [Ramularia collo-cygni]|uniref:Related to exopolyphosphatase n=1 Tax=Ramularia collo-cygni TaxID=112498 RepID=A0A2D3V507_9PEZI|nr:related to exopolyphosphatase [Ramularia collo-cygni]CZT21775.1 related to exopolyphosphatase [Ramularia collo-cygni]